MRISAPAGRSRAHASTFDGRGRPGGGRPGRGEGSGDRLQATGLPARKGDSGCYAFSVGTAGSATLVLQAVLPALFDWRFSELILEGGTHNPLAPPSDFLAKAYLRSGKAGSAQSHRDAIVPAGLLSGGGRAVFGADRPAPCAGVTWNSSSGITAPQVRALMASLPRHIAERECRTIAAKIPVGRKSALRGRNEETSGAGQCRCDRTGGGKRHRGIYRLGQLGVKAEEVAMEPLREAKKYLAAGVPVRKHLADQLMLPLGIGAWLGSGGGVFRTMALSLHAETHLEILRSFLEIKCQADCDGPAHCLVQIGSVSPPTDNRQPTTDNF